MTLEPELRRILEQLGNYYLDAIPIGVSTTPEDAVKEILALLESAYHQGQKEAYEEAAKVAVKIGNKTGDAQDIVDAIEKLIRSRGSKGE